MIELSNQECRDLKGSLSNRGCYFDKEGKPTEKRQKAVSFSCLDCGQFTMDSLINYHDRS